MKEIKLTQGMVAFVDDEDYEAVNQYKWHINKKSNTFYAVRTLRKPDGAPTTQKMHQLILNARGIDHINHNGLDNRRSNLRIVTQKQNIANARSRGGTSRFKGLYWDKKKNKWRVQIFIRGKRKHLGMFNDEVEAARIYNFAARYVYGEYAFLNDVPPRA